MLNKLEEYKIDLQRNKSDKTVKSYMNKVENFLKFADGKELSQELLQEYLDSRNEMSYSTLNTDKVAITGYMRLLGIDNVNVKFKSKKAKTVATYVTEEDYQKLMNHVIENTERNRKDIPKYKVLVMLGGRCGLRPSEAMGLTKENILKNNRIKIVEGKGDRDREVSLSEENMKILQEYVNTVEENVLFPFTYKTYAEHFRNYARVLNKEGVYTPHSLRHLTATRLLNNRANPKEVAEFLGNGVDVVLSTYGHLTEARLDEMALD